MVIFHKRYNIVNCTWGYGPDGNRVYICELFDNKKQWTERYTYSNHPDPVNFFHEKVLLMNREEDDLILYTTAVYEYIYDDL
jgi:hypothetical protein